jgi:hypothetical protein
MLLEFRRHLSAIVFTAAAVACGGDSTGPTSNGPATLSQALAELTIPALAVGGLSLVDIDTPAASLEPTTCPYSAEVQSFVCAPISESGITVKQSFTLLSASGAKQSAFDPASTASIRVAASVEGTVVAPGISLAVSGQRETTLSGLDSGAHVLNGWVTDLITGTVEEETETYPVSMRVNTSIFELVLPAYEAGNGRVWPSSGRITGYVNGSVGPLPVSQETVILFRGTSEANVSVSSGFLSKTCKVDLAVAQAACD